jgi:hypothetical protein
VSDSVTHEREARRYVAEGVMPASTYAMAPVTGSTLGVSVALLAFAALSVVVELPWYGLFFFVMVLLIHAPRALFALRYARARGRAVEPPQRFEVSDDGITHAWTKPDGTKAEKHYEWFLFEQHVVEPHRVVLWLRTPTVPGRTIAEVLLLPQPLFGTDYGDVCALVAEHVKKPAAPAPAQPTPGQSWKTIALWLALVGLFALVYWQLGAR